MRYHLSFVDLWNVPIEAPIDFTDIDTFVTKVKDTGYVKWMVEWVKQELNGDIGEDFPISLTLDYKGSGNTAILTLEEVE